MHARNEMSEKKVEREGVVRGGECEGGEGWVTMKNHSRIMWKEKHGKEANLTYFFFSNFLEDHDKENMCRSR